MRGLLVIEPLYHQIVAGNKTQTRRSSGLEEVNDFDMQMNGYQRSPDDSKLLATSIEKDGRLLVSFDKPSCTTFVLCKSRYKIGEVLYLKEPYRTVDPPVYIEYAFDNKDRTGIKYENKLFMPEAFAREFIRITGIRCERLLDISDHDCIAEGITNTSQNRWVNYLPKHSFPDYNNPRSSFLSLYKFANKVKEVENIWCWVYNIEYLPNYKA